MLTPYHVLYYTEFYMNIHQQILSAHSEIRFSNQVNRLLWSAESIGDYILPRLILVPLVSKNDKR